MSWMELVPGLRCLFYFGGLKDANELDWIVDSHYLLPHTAEIDYLLPPLVMVFPSSPSRHNTYYALAVVNARDVHEHRLPHTPGMQSLSSQERMTVMTDSPRSI